MKQVQIPEMLFIALVKYHLCDMPSEATAIKNGLENKLDSMVKRQLYTTYKTAQTEQDREQARKEYLDRIGMRDSFRW